MLLSWLVITNHCAFAWMLIEPAAGAEHAHCHPAANDSPNKVPGDGVRECCRTIKASLAARMESEFDAAPFQLQAWAIAWMIAAPTAKPALSFFRDHGPPGAISFAEIVLQHSLLSHAPPAVV